MYNQLIYFIIALVLFAIQEPGAEPFLPLWETILLGVSFLVFYAVICRAAYRRLQHALAEDLPRSLLILRYLADMISMRPADDTPAWWQREPASSTGRTTVPLNSIKEPPVGDGTLTLSEAALLYRAFFPSDEQIDLSNLRRRFLSSHHLQPLDEERSVRGRETDWRRMSRAYLYQEA